LAALDIEDDMEKFYNNIVIATDADVDGMHIRLLLITFSTIFPELIKDGHLYIQTPLSEYETRKKLFIVILMKNEK
jgi:DNA gyrase/topoisomerase IV subunit B